MSKMSAKRFNFITIIFLLSAGILPAQSQSNIYSKENVIFSPPTVKHFDKWAGKNFEWAFTNSNVAIPDSLKNVMRFIPNGYRIDKIYAGFLDCDNLEDYAIILLPDSFKENYFYNNSKYFSDFQFALRPLLIILSNQGDTKTLENKYLITPYRWSPHTMFMSIAFENHDLYLLYYIGEGAPQNQSYFAMIYHYDRYKKLINLNNAEYHSNNHQWEIKSGHYGKYFEQTQYFTR